MAPFQDSHHVEVVVEEAGEVSVEDEEVEVEEVAEVASVEAEVVEVEEVAEAVSVVVEVLAEEEGVEEVSLFHLSYLPAICMSAM